MKKRLQASQVFHNLLKTVRTNTRLAHSLAAGNELNELEDRLKATYDEYLQGRGPAAQAVISAELTAMLERVLNVVLVRVQEQVRTEQKRAARRALRA